MISDEEYDTFILKQIIQLAKKNNSYNQLPRLILYIDQRMKEEKEKKENIENKDSNKV